jgi:long-subunit fatty acid transport protein
MVDSPHNSGTGRRVAPVLAGLLLAGALPHTAHASGIEDTVAGTIGLGRSASYARVNDFMATWQNPANLAIVPGNDLGLELRLPILKGCFDREIDPNVEYRQPGIYEGFEGTESFGKVCNEANPFPAPNLGWAHTLDGRWGYGIGVFTPSAVGSSQYGDDTIVTLYPSENELYESTNAGVESPNRQMGLERRVIAAYMMAGIGAQVIPELRFGLSAGLGYYSIYNKSVVSVLGGTFRDQEIINELDTRDWAVPRLTGSIVVTPIDFIDLFAVATYQGDIESKGTSKLTANGVSGAPLNSCTDEVPGTHCKIDDVKLIVPLHTLEATFGARFVLRRTGERTLDPMHDEVFDIEVDVAWAQTSNVDAFRVELHDKKPGDPDFPRVQFANDPMAGVSYVRNTTEVPKHWKDTWTVRVGGDVQVLPERLSLRGGFSYATSAVPVRYMNFDYWPVEKISVHVGATVAFLERFKLSAAYAHIFYQPVEVSVGTGGVKDIASVEEASSTGVNEGRFEASQDIFSMQFNTQF